MTVEETLIDQYVTGSGVMLARLGDHLITLDELRKSHHDHSLQLFGLDQVSVHHGDSLRSLLTSHTERYDVHMAMYLRYAHVVLTYMVLEDRLKAFGNLITATKRGQSFRSGSDLLNRFQKYLESLGLPPPDQGVVDTLRKIRNCIVHENGQLGRTSNGLGFRSPVGKIPGVASDASGCLTLTTEACLFLQEGVSEYLRAVDESAGFHITVPQEVRESFEQNLAPHLRETRL